MNDEELRRILQSSLADRRAPEAVKERVLKALHGRRPWVLAAAGLAAAALLAAGGAFLLAPREAKIPAVVTWAVEQHAQTEVFGHALSAQTPVEVSRTVSEASGHEVELSALRDAGFVHLQSHRCEDRGTAHVVYSNAWLKVSCYILEGADLDLAAGRRLSDPGVEATSFATGKYSAVAVREGGIIKLWVGDLRAEQLAAIAIDAEQKRYQLKTTVLSVTDKGMTGPLRAALRNTPGVEDVQMEASKQEAYVRYDRRRVSPDEIAAMLFLNGFAASPRDWEGR